jgi:hypothetical protein
VERITVKALLRPQALARLAAHAHRFCASPDCFVVYFGEEDVFRVEDVVVPVLQKTPPGARTLCYCFDVGESDVSEEIARTGRSTAAARIAEHVKAGRCACEVRNPEGRCCLGHVAEAVKALVAGAAGR